MPDKKELLKEILESYAKKDVMVAFSGGTDSSLLLMIMCETAKELKRKVYAVTMQTSLQPVQELSSAIATAEEIGAEHIIIPVDELKEANIIMNPVNRCYLCKKYLFSKLREKAEELGIETIMEGTNEDDLHVFRPGLKALKELNIISPLAEAGLSKHEIRNLAKEYGLSIAQKPAAPCLATRFPYGTMLSYQKIEQVEKGEAYLKSMGFQNVRLRVHDTVARIEVDESDFERLLILKKEIISYLQNIGYRYITLDMEGFRSGSMDMV